MSTHGSHENGPEYSNLILDTSPKFIGLLSKEGIVIEFNAPDFIKHTLQHDEVIGQYIWDTQWWQGYPDT